MILIVGMEKLETAQPHTCALGQSVNDQQILGSNSIEGKVAKRCQKDISHGTLYFYFLCCLFGAPECFQFYEGSSIFQDVQGCIGSKNHHQGHINTVCSSPQSLHHEVPEPTNLDVVLSSLEDFWSGGQSWACRKRSGIATESAIAPFCGQHVLFRSSLHVQRMKPWNKLEQSAELVTDSLIAC